VSAGNSQRNSPAVSECQEELNNAVILSRTTRPSPETSPSAPHETPNIQYQYTGREWRPFHVRPRWRMNWSSILLPDRSLRCQRVKVARRRGGVNLRHIINTTSLRPPTSQNTSHHAEHRTHLQTRPSPPLTTRRHVENHLPSLTKHPTCSTSTREGSGAPFMYALGWKMDFGTPSSCPTIVYGMGS
jgi:hypothetical protein